MFITYLKSETLFTIVMVLAAWLFISVTPVTAANIDWLLEILDDQVADKLDEVKKIPLGDTVIGQGLREALEIGIDRAVQRTGKVGGYFNYEAIKILLPERFQRVERFLRRMGQGEKIDAFVLSMNRAAESAAPHARDIFIDALMAMTFDDAQGILQDGDTAATAYFRSKTYKRLEDVFTESIAAALDENEVTGQYRQIFGRFKSLPFLKRFEFNLERYVVGKALDGLFHVLGEEERKIRNDPAARVTDLLQKVFI